MKWSFGSIRAALLVAVPLSVLSFSEPASAQVKCAVSLKDGSMYQGQLVEYLPMDHVTIELAGGETRRFSWDALAQPAQPSASQPSACTSARSSALSDDQIAALSSARAALALQLARLSGTGVSGMATTLNEPTSTDEDEIARPNAGAWLVDLRVPMSLVFSSPHLTLQSLGLDVGVGNRLSDRVYLGGFAGIGQNWDLGSGRLFATGRAGLELHYNINQSTAQVSTSGEDGPYYPVPRYDWLGVRAGVEAVRSQSPTGAFAELDLGTDAWLSPSFQFGMVLGAGLSFEPAGRYPNENDFDDAAPTPTTKTVNPYLTLAFHFGVGG